MPWGFHAATLPFLVQGLIAAVSALIVMAYYTLLEAREGRSLGKRALELRVVRADGAPMTHREAFVRNLVKLSPPVLALDVLVMLLAFREEKQRASDRIAGTVVVRA